MPNAYLSADFAPVQQEVTAIDLPVSGHLPPELEGRYLRNGANPLGELTPATHHWFSGHGMVHGVRLRGGRAEWYRNRWVRGGTVSQLLGEPPLPSPSRRPTSSANTSVRHHAGRTPALVEGGALPIELDHELNSVAAADFGGTLPGGFTAHPEIDPVTGEMHAVCYSWRELADHVQYVVVGTDGLVRRVVDVPLPDAWTTGLRSSPACGPTGRADRTGSATPLESTPVSPPVPPTSTTWWPARAPSTTTGPDDLTEPPVARVLLPPARAARVPRRRRPGRRSGPGPVTGGQPRAGGSSTMPVQNATAASSNSRPMRSVAR